MGTFGGSARRAVLVLSLFLVLFDRLCTANLATEATCGTEVAASSVSLSSQIEFEQSVKTELARVVDGVRAECQTITSCSGAKLDKVLSAAVDRHVKKQKSFFRKLMTLPRRALVFAIYVTSVVGPGLLTYQLASGLGEGKRIILGSAVSGMFVLLLGRTGDALEKMFGPHLEQCTLILWDPDAEDSWGEIQRVLNEKDRLINSQVYNQLILLGRHFATAGRAVRRHNVALAARHYKVAVLNSYFLFKGLHYYHPSTLVEVRSWLPDLNDIPEDIKVKIIVEVCRQIMDARPDEVKGKVDREELTRFAFGVLLSWLVGPTELAPGPLPPVALQVQLENSN